MPDKKRDFFTEMIPANTDAEKTILGSLMLDGSRILEIAGMLTPDDFFLDSHRRIFQRMIALANDERPIDLVTLASSLREAGELSAVGGVAYIGALTDGLPRHPVVEEYIRMVRQYSISRAVIATAAKVGAMAEANQLEGTETASWGIAELSRVIEESVPNGEIANADSLAEDAEYRLIDNPQDVPAIATGIEALDEITNGGIRLGELWVVGASPSRGKTTLARQVVKHAIERDVPAYVHSGEMTKESWTDVTACLIEEMPTYLIRDPRLMNLTDKERLRCGLRKLGKMPFHISDAGGIHIDRLIFNATKAKRQWGIKLFVVDYAQIIAASGRDPRERVTEIAQRCRLFAKDNNVATILLSQSPRPQGTGINTKPTLFSLKESGALEEAAHAVVLPFRPMDTERDVFTGEDELIIGKQRWGPIGSVPVTLNGKYLRFDPR